MAAVAKTTTTQTTTEDRASHVDALYDINSASDHRQRETAEYISDMILELRNLAKSVQLYQVMVPLEYAYYEAYGAANKVVPPAEDAQRLRHLSQIGEMAATEAVDQD